MITLQTTKKEIWKDIKGYEGIYQASNMGNIRSLYFYNNRYKTKHYRKKLMKQSEDKQGYKIISLSKNKKQKTYKVHRLIAQTFIKNPDDKKEVNHIDGNKSNNEINNLEWCTRSENQIHAYKNKLQRQTKKMKIHSIELGKKYGKMNGSKTGKENIKKAIEKRKIPVNQYTLTGQYIKTWPSMSEAARNIRTYKSLISSCSKGIRESAGGYKWKIA